MPTTIQVRRSTQSEWNTNSSVVLLAGEAGYETDTGNIKIGDGSTTWANLKYQLPYNTGSRDSALTSTLTIDNANDRVGIGASSPTEKLSVGGNATISGTLSAGDTTLSGDLAVNGGDITTTSGTLNVASTLTSAQTVNVATGVTASGSTKAINIGTGGASGSTTNVNIGSSTSGATGTATINNATTAIAGILNLAGNLAIATNKFNVTAASGNTTIAGTLSAASLALTNDLPISEGGTGASDAGTARTNLGLGTIATQASDNVTITGGSISNITDLPIADGGTGASDAATARSNLAVSSAESATTITGTGTVTLTMGSIPIGQIWSKVYTFTQTGNNQYGTVTMTTSGTERGIVFVTGASSSALWIATFSDIQYATTGQKWYNVLITDSGTASAQEVDVAYGTSFSFGWGQMGITTRSVTVFILRTK